MTLELLNKGLIEAAKSGDAPLCLDHLSRGADIEGRLLENRTALGWAARNGRTSTCMALLDRGADIEAMDEDRRTPVGLAARLGYAHTCRALLTRGAAPDARDNQGRTALGWAGFNGNTENCLIMLHGGANIESMDEDQRTVLGWAFHTHRTQTCLALIAKRASVASVGRVKKSPWLDWTRISRLTPLEAAAECENDALLLDVLQTEPEDGLEARLEALLPLVRRSNNGRAEFVLRSWLAARQARSALDEIFEPSAWMECVA